MKMYTSEELSIINDTINSELGSIKMEIEELEEMTKPIPPDDAYGRVSRMDAINQKSRNEALLRDAKDKRSKLERALNRIGKDDFGKCKICGELISMERILFMPETDRCKLHANH